MSLIDRCVCVAATVAARAECVWVSACVCGASLTGNRVGAATALLQIDAIRRGFGTIVPLKVLQLGSWEQLQLRVCGSPEVDVSLLRSNTNY